VLAKNQAAPRDITVDGAAVYWTNLDPSASGKGAVMKVAKP
jgi:hypothetical protein